MPSPENIERVRRGAAWLDKKLGRGWRRKIRRRQLDMSMGYMCSPSDCGCILAQLDFARSGDGIGSYSRGIGEVGLDFEEAEDLGFDDAGSDEVWEDLTEAWREELRGGVGHG